MKRKELKELLKGVEGADEILEQIMAMHGETTKEALKAKEEAESELKKYQQDGEYFADVEKLRKANQDLLSEVTTHREFKTKVEQEKRKELTRKEAEKFNAHDTDLLIELLEKKQGIKIEGDKVTIDEAIANEFKKEKAYLFKEEKPVVTGTGVKQNAGDYTQAKAVNKPLIY